VTKRQMKKEIERIQNMGNRLNSEKQCKLRKKCFMVWLNRPVRALFN
jgi:hypothetical protein